MAIREHEDSRTFFGHPIGLTNLFGVELWERFSFYGMLTILGYYLYYSVTDGGLGLPQSTATGIVGAYGGLVYLSTVLGGWVADRLLGMERTVFYGGVVVMLGHIALAVLPGLSGVGAGLVLVALGSGALKANASSLLGTLYGKNDARADGGFTLFYLGINLGAFTGPLITGVVGTTRISYDARGETMLVASSLEQQGSPGAVKISAATRDRLDPARRCEPAGEIVTPSGARVDAFLVRES